MHRGWISIHRKLAESKIYRKKPFDDVHAWIDLLILANHDESEIMIGRKSVKVERGSLITSMVSLSERWGWSRSKTMDYIKFLEKENMITRKSNNKSTTINIVNYSVYQDSQTAKPTSNKHQAEHQKNIKLNTNNNINNVNNINNNSNINNIIDLSNKGGEKKSEACDAIKRMRQEYEERVKPKYSVWEEHQCSGTLDRLREEYDGVFDEKYVWMADQP